MKRTVFISIVGRPNVGKSTLMNAILGQKIAIVSDKPQTTRTRIAGIETRGDDQYVFLDTPGIFKPRNELGDYMVKTATNTLAEGDVVILVADVTKDVSEVEQNIIKIVQSRKIPCILALNKIDLTRREHLAETIAKYAALYNFDAVVPISAQKGKYVEDVIGECSKFLKEGEWFYEEDDITDQPERQMVAEVIREKILRTIDKEVPHGVAIAIEEFKVDENTGFISIRAEIFCERTSHKSILVGKNGETLKRIGTYAREEIEKMLDAKCYLNLWVKVKENWRDSKREVVGFGYDNQ